MKVLSVVGTRPQFVKAFPVSRELRDAHEEVLVHTGQHYDERMSSVFFEELDLEEPDYDLGVGSGTHGWQTGNIVAQLGSIVDQEDPDAVLTYGDSNSTLAAAIVAAKVDPTLVHIEAGLRSGRREMPEEINRVLTDHVSDLLLTPTERASESLASEGLTDSVYVTGDVMYDAVLWARNQARDVSTITEDVGIDDGEYVLATVHRQRNTDDRARLEAILEGLTSSPRPVVLPAHPRTESRLREYGLWDRARDALTVIDPVGYVDFVRLLDGADRVVTDSGGVQKEAFFLDTPCVTLREETEWVETVEAGWNELVGADPAAIERALSRPWELGEKPDLYGNGTAADRVAELIATKA